MVILLPVIYNRKFKRSISLLIIINIFIELKSKFSMYFYYCKRCETLKIWYMYVVPTENICVYYFIQHFILLLSS